jgi:hypothetical protein
MHEKNIKRIITKQLKKYFPNWKKLSRKQKKAIASQVQKEVTQNYSFKETTLPSSSELIGIPDIEKEPGIMTIEEMGAFVADHNRKLFKFPKASNKYITDPELVIIDDLLDNTIVDRLLAPEGFTPSKRDIFPSHLLRAELHKSLKFPELSYRKYCEIQLNTLEQKAVRAFVGLPLKQKLKIHHGQLSTFRSALTFTQLTNLMVYMLHLFKTHMNFNWSSIVHGVDSTELPAICNPFPLATIEVLGKKVRIYSDLDADCGKRRRKRDKSDFFVGYRLHTLTVINPETGHCFPLISLVAPANHHDSLFLKPLIQMGQAIGLNMNIIVADEAYGAAEETREIKQEHGIEIVSSPRAKVLLPDFVDQETCDVFFSDLCDIPMTYLGKDETGDHEFKCAAAPGQCFHSDRCPQCRLIPIDAGCFGAIPKQVEAREQAIDLRKNIERPFNLLKHREGLEPLRVRSQQGVMAVATFATMANLFLEITATRKTKKKEEHQMSLDIVA